jgi:hypothetical protein
VRGVPGHRASIVSPAATVGRQREGVVGCPQLQSTHDHGIGAGDATRAHGRARPVPGARTREASA